MPCKTKKTMDLNLDALASARPYDVSAMDSKVTGDLSPATLSRLTLNSSDQELAKLVTWIFSKKYGQTPRLKQVESVVSLAKGHNTVLLAGTGYGKTRIAETFWMLFTKNCLAIVVVLNPLDVLGNNQVSVSSLAWFSVHPLLIHLFLSYSHRVYKYFTDVILRSFIVFFISHSPAWC